MKKNVKALILSLLAALAVGSMSACKSDKGESSSTDITSESVNESVNESVGGSEEDEEITISLAETESVMRFASKQLTATVKGTQEKPVWTSSNPAVATVDENGLVSALTLGEAVITATIGNVSASCTVTVTETNIPHEIEVSLEEISVFEGKTSEEITVGVSYNGETVEGSFQYTWSLVEGGEDIVEIATTNNGQSATFTALKPGTVTFEIYTEARGYEASKLVTVTVKENTYSLGIAHKDIVTVGDGYAVDLTLGNEDTDKVTFGDAYLAVNGAESSETVAVNWSLNNDNATFVDGTLTAVKAGTAVLTGTATYKEKTLTVKLTVTIVKGQETIDDTDMLEVATATSFEIPASVEKGEVEKIYFGDVVVFDKAAGVSSLSGNVVTFNDKTSLPVKDEDLGLGKELKIETNLVVYTMSVDVYTMIIDTVEELDAWQEVAAENAVKAGLCIAEQKGLAYNGYFVLGANIEYNKVWAPYKKYGDLWALCYQNKDIWVDQSNYANGKAPETSNMVAGAIVEDWGTGKGGGFKGTFDGQGYYINGLSTANGADYNAFIVTLGGGTIKNVAFLNTTIGSNCGSVVDRGEGTIENVYLQVKEMQSGKAEDKKTWGLIRSGNNAKHTVISSIIDYSTVDVTNLEYVILGCDITSEVLQGVYLIGVPADYEGDCWNHAGVDRHQLGSYETYADLFADTAAANAVSEWSNVMWEVGNGYVVANAAKQFYTGNVTITNVETEVPAGTSVSVSVDKYAQYVVYSLKEAVEGVSIKGKEVSVEETVTAGTTFTVVATFLLDGTTSEKTFTVGKALEKVVAENVVDVDLGVYLDGVEVKKGETATLALDEIYNNYLKGNQVIVKYGKKVVYEGVIDSASWTMSLNDFAVTAAGESTLVFVCYAAEKNYEVTLPINFVQATVELNSTNVTSPADLCSILKSNPYGNYVLTSDLNMKGAGLKGIENFYGTIDGNGYVITNTYIHHDALPIVGGQSVYNPTFIMHNYGTIKNIGFELSKLTQTTGGKPRGIVYTNYGTIESVYVDVTFVEEQVTEGKDVTYYTTGALATCNEGTVKNVLVTVKLAAGAVIIKNTTAGVVYENKATVENVYTINNGVETVEAVMKGASASCVLYSAWAELTEADLTALGSLWKKEGETLYFGKTVIYDATVREEIEDTILANANNVATLTNAAFTVGSKWEVSVNGGEASNVVISEEGKLAITLDTATLNNGYLAVVTVKGVGQELRYNNVLVPIYISTAEELKALGVGGNRTNTSDIEGYYMLANDIVFEHSDDYSDLVAAGYPKNGDYYFKGTFDGNGYSLKNMRVSDGGIFGLMRNATVKNLKIENVYLTNNPKSGVSNQNGAYISILAFAAPTSTFEDITITVAAAPNAWSWKRDGLFVCTGSWGESTYRNITVDASYLSLNTLLGISHNNKNVYENVVIKAAEYVAIGYTADSYATVDGKGVQNTGAMLTEFPAGVTFQKVAYADVPNAIKASNAVSNVKYLSDNETALGFAAGTHVYEVTTTNMWNDRIVIPADDSYDYVEFDIVFTTAINYATAWPSPGSGTYGSFGIYTKGLVISNDGKTRVMQVYKANGDTFKAQSGDKFEANTKYTIRIGFNKGEHITNFNFGTDTNQTYYISASRFGNYNERVYVSDTGALHAYYEGDVTALGFAADTKVSAVTMTDGWSNRVRVNTDATYDYVEVTFATDKAFNLLCLWAYGINGSILPGNYSGTAASIVPNTDNDPAKVAEARKIVVTDLAGNAVSAFAANTVYKVRIYLNGNTSVVNLGSFNSSAENPITFYFGSISYGNDPVSNER